jgi:hypothetical protein
MTRFELRDEVLKAIFWIRAVQLKCYPRRNHLVAPPLRTLNQLAELGIAKVFRPRYTRAGEVWSLTRQGLDLINEIMTYEEENPRYSTEEGPSALLHRGNLLTWSHRTAVHEIENLRRMRQGNEERAAKRAGRTGCHETRLRAQPRPKVAICVDGCGDRKRIR